MRHLTGLKVLAIAITLCGCQTKGGIVNNENDLQTYPVVQLSETDTVLHHHYVADIQAVRNVEIRARISGFLNKIYVDEGRPVKQGQLLFSVSDEEFQANLASAKAVLKSAIAEAKGSQLEVDRIKILVDKKVLSKTELDVAEAKLAAYNAKIDEARSAEANAATQLSYTLIRAPFDGFIDRIPLKAGTYISEGNLLTTVSDNSEVYAYFNVSETEYLEYSRSRETRSDRKVQLILADGTPYASTGKIETLESEFEENTGSIAFRARFPNPKQLLKHGASGKVVLTNQLEDALLLPQKAVFEMQDKNYVYVLDSANQVKMKSFASHARIKHSYIVQDGLEPGEKVVYEGVRSLREGMRIKPQMLRLDTLSAL